MTPAFILQVYKRTPEGHTRYGITASRKVGGAVERNRAKRRLRVLIKQTLPVHPPVGVDYVFIARTEILRRNFALLGQEMTDVFKRAQRRL